MSKASNKNKIRRQHQLRIEQLATVRAHIMASKKQQAKFKPAVVPVKPLPPRDDTPSESLKRAVYERHRPAISEISREATAGGVIYRFGPTGLEILLVADRFERWTIPKGHIEAGETAQETAIREIGEEAGVHQLEPVCWLGKIHFRYRRDNVLVLMSTQIYLFKALGDTNDIKKEDWMSGIRWFSYDAAVKIIAYKDIAKLMRLGYRRLEQKGEI